MSIWETFTMALQNVVASKMRTFLTMIGIIIGIVAVIIIVGLGNGLQTYIEDTFDSMGANNLFVVITGRGASSKTMSADQIYDIYLDNEMLAAMSPTVTVSGSVKIGSDTLDATSITGVSEEYFDIQDYAISQGRNLVYGDMSSRSQVCVIGAYLNQEYFDGAGLGQSLKILGNEFQVVGIMEVEDENNLDEGGTDDAVFLPYSTASRLSMTAITSYTVSLVDETLIDECEAAIEAELYDFFGDEDSYRIVNMSSLVGQMQDMVGIMVMILTAIAGISLVVGGIGIMNIMLVSVTERTKEIGIRKSLGAKERYIMRQFIMEAATTSALGGAIGIALGFAGCSAATAIIAQISTTPLSVLPSTEAILVAFGISFAIGVLFGYLPAKKASRLNPIDALKYE